MKFEQLEQKRAVLKRENIHHLTADDNFLKPWHKDLNWPMELQGTGRKKPDNPLEYEIYYPVGDVFVSFATIIHEIGHIRQDELMPDNEPDDDDNLEAQIAKQESKELDAYERGWLRILQYRPDIIDDIEERFRDYKQQGLLTEFESFQELYKFMNGSIEINRLMFELADIDGDSEEGAQVIKTRTQQNEDIMNFLQTLNNSKVGELIDTDLVDELLLEIVEKINQE